jgi:CRP/FNR family cyclic AMP-dependent transcriptional regulator
VTALDYGMKRLELVDSTKFNDIINKISFFDDFSEDEKELLAGFHSQFFVAKSGTHIIEQGGSDQSFYIILTGQVSVQHANSDTHLAVLNPGDFFGEVSFLTDRKRTTSIVAESKSILFEIDKTTLRSLPPSIREKLKDNIIQVLVVRLDQMNQRVAELTQTAAS